MSRDIHFRASIKKYVLVAEVKVKSLRENPERKDILMVTEDRQNDSWRWSTFELNIKFDLV